MYPISCIEGGSGCKDVELTHQPFSQIIQLVKPLSSRSIPLAQESVQAGFPSPADPYLTKSLDFNEYLIKNPNATIAIRVSGDAMQGVGIGNGDLLVVDRSLTPLHDDIVIVEYENEYLVRQLKITSRGLQLEAAHLDYPTIRPSSETTVAVMGVVLYTIKRNR